MRCFGALIKQLETRSKYVPSRERYALKRYMNQYCCGSLIKLEFEGNSLQNLTNRFEQVEVVRFTSGPFECTPADIQRCYQIEM